MTEEELKRDWQLITDYWKLIKQWSGMEWRERISSGAEFVKAHGSGRYVKDLVLSYMNELERREKGRNE